MLSIPFAMVVSPADGCVSVSIGATVVPVPLSACFVQDMIEARTKRLAATARNFTGPFMATPPQIKSVFIFVRLQFQEKIEKY
jgi:hypothetical protein